VKTIDQQLFKEEIPFKKDVQFAVDLVSEEKCFDYKILKLKCQRYPRWPPKAVFLNLGYYSKKNTETRDGISNSTRF
jgi:hypothetical protein